MRSPGSKNIGHSFLCGTTVRQEWKYFKSEIPRNILRNMWVFYEEGGRYNCQFSKTVADNKSPMNLLYVKQIPGRVSPSSWWRTNERESGAELQTATTHCRDHCKIFNPGEASRRQLSLDSWIITITTAIIGEPWNWVRKKLDTQKKVYVVGGCREQRP